MGRGGVGPDRAGHAVRGARRALASAISRAATECATYASAAAISVLVALRGAAGARIHATGGASRNALWAQALADVLGREVEVADVAEPSATGGAALVRPGSERGWGERAPTRRFEPAPERHDRYVVHAARYREVFERLEDAFGEAA